jgi:DNA ligase D-like protein (predicted polymerase)
MQRFPHGATGSSFFQKRVPDNAPDWLETTIVSTPNGTDSRALVAADLAHIAWAVNLGCLGFHVWPAHADDPEHADELRIDLDPQPGTSFEEARAAAVDVRALFDELGIVAHPKTTGNRGIHVYVRLLPQWDSIQVRRAAVAAARELARRNPTLITDAWWKEERGERIFIDFNQMARDRTMASAYSVRPSPRALVSTPVTWAELPDVLPTDFDVRTMPERFAKVGDLMAGMQAQASSLEPLLEMAARDERDYGLGDMPYPPEYPKMPGEPLRVQPSRKAKQEDE